MDRYCIKAGYRVNDAPCAYEDSVEDSTLYQVPVYEAAARLAAHPRVRSALDLGCGLGTKLMTRVLPFCDAVVGVDLPGTISRCQRLHPGGTWIAGSLEDPGFSIDGSYDLVISADVIEHLRDPDVLLRRIVRASHGGTFVVLSTPDRELRRGEGDMGPPGNDAHVREWSRPEFCEYLESRRFRVQDSRIVELAPGTKTCHLVVARPPL